MTAAAPARLTALDLLRGLAVAAMILVNNPGDWSHIYAPLRHAEWSGWTPTDMIFPTFLFGVGTALGLSFPRAMGDTAARRTFWRRVARRTASLVLIGLALEATYNLSIALGAPYAGGAGLADLRLPGVLQRIGLCYALAAVVAVGTGRRDADGRVGVRAGALALVAVAILAGYALVLAGGTLDRAGNVPAMIDRALFGVRHLWPLGSAVPGEPVVYDPEGLLSTLPATVNVLAGMLAAVAWRRLGARAVAVIAGGGLIAFAAGLALSGVLPINKSLWTSSFALLSSGFSAMLLAVLALIPAGRWQAPLRLFGSNAIVAYVLSILIARIYSFPVGGGSIGGWWYTRILTAIGAPTPASLVFALTIVALVATMLAPLHRRGLFLRV